MRLPSSTEESHATVHPSHPHPLPLIHPRWIPRRRREAPDSGSQVQKGGGTVCCQQENKWKPHKWQCQYSSLAKLSSPIEKANKYCQPDSPNKKALSVHALKAPSRRQCAQMISKDFFGVSHLNMIRQSRINRHLMKASSRKGRDQSTQKKMHQEKRETMPEATKTSPKSIVSSETQENLKL